MAVGTILSSTFFFALDNTIVSQLSVLQFLLTSILIPCGQVAAVQASILKTMGTIEQLPWLGVAFALGGVTILPWYLFCLHSHRAGELTVRVQEQGIWNLQCEMAFHI